MMLSDMVHEVAIAAKPQAIYRAITTSEGEAGFWVPKNTMSPTIGHVASFEFKGAPVALRMRVDALEENRRVALTCLGEFPGWRDTTVTWTLKPGADETTTVEFRMGNLGGYPPEAVGSVNYTWGQIVGRLKAFVESGKPQPFLE